MDWKYELLNLWIIYNMNGYIWKSMSIFDQINDGYIIFHLELRYSIKKYSSRFIFHPNSTIAKYSLLAAIGVNGLDVSVVKVSPLENAIKELLSERVYNHGRKYPP